MGRSESGRIDSFNSEGLRRENYKWSIIRKSYKERNLHEKSMLDWRTIMISIEILIQLVRMESSYFGIPLDNIILVYIIWI